MALTYRTVSTPLGDITAVADEAGLTQVILAGDDGSVLAEATEGGPIVDAAATQLAEYFAGERMAFDVPLTPQGTEFQQTVWKALGDVPFGTTATYGEIARAIGQLTATRAVGAANGRNPIPIIIPCHRVIGASGELTGYSGFAI
jgi:methylated-DNA-[protein]-cysteine S-methyltransferase